MREQSPVPRERTLPRERALIRVLPPLLLIGGVCFDALTPPEFTAAPLFAAAPLIAAPFFRLRTTVAVAAASCAAVLTLRMTHRVGGADVQVVTELLTMLTVGVLAVVINRVVRRGDARLASARSIAEATQRAVLPQPDPRIGGLDIAARYEAAQADAFIGGDLYAVQDTPHGVRLVVGDVRGKGMGAVSAVAVVIGAFREAAEQEASLEAVAQRLERALAREGMRRDGLDAFEGFTTAVLAEIPRGADGIVRIINRGHPEPLLLRGDGRLCVLTPSEHALPLGMGDLGTWPDRADETPFPPGTTLLLHTDGLSEARDEHGEFYDPATRLGGRIFPGPSGPDALLATLVDEVRRHTGGGATDDMALLAVRRPLTPRD
ncbi:PP2C family protein-serine/threonine phosphatase [Streptomyces lasiicapitis]|uniref:PP2C family protein-serine/threonine phosphatase n=1 Tax=Streptomyces lasiicapitis TaxID=1923961 RepID=UPI001E2D638D|nr:PP2C family protein-serine/threonine phosphatase [Streptomyces lasiicapitis]